MKTEKMRQQTHFYILSDGRRVENMKEGCEALNVSSGIFRMKVKSGEIKSIKINNKQANELLSKEIQNEETSK